MKLNRLFLLGIALISTIVCSATASWSATEAVRQVIASRVASSPVIDGKMGDPAWGAATETGGFTVLRSLDKAPATPTYVKCLTDGKSLYIGFRCEEPKMSETKSAVAERDGSVWEQDCVEVIIDPFGDRKVCYDLVAGMAGSQRDAKLTILPTGAINQDLRWNGDWEVKTWRGENEWRAEMRIPFSAVEIDPAKNSVVGINFNRTRQVGATEYSNWSPNTMYFSEPSNLGELIIPDERGDYCNVKLPRLRSIVAGKNVYSTSILNHTGSKIEPKLDFTITGKTGQKNIVAAGSVDPGAENVSNVPVTVETTGHYALLMNVTDSVTGKQLYRLYRDIEVTQPFVFDEALYALYHKRVESTVESRVDPGKEVVKVSLVKDGTDKAINSKVIRAWRTPIKISFSLSGQTDGVYRLRVELVRNGKVEATSLSRAFPYKANPRIGMNKDGYLLVDGKPFFPVGIYSLTNGDLAKSTQIAKEAAAAGFNSTVLYHEDWSVLKTALDACQEGGVKAFVYPTLVFSRWKDGVTQERVHQDLDLRRNHPAVLGWYVVDEPEGIGLAPVEPVRDMYQRIKEYDQDHPCSLVIMSPMAATDYNSACDIMWTDPYPIPGEPITRVSETVGGTVKNVQKDKPVWCIPQAFDWAVWNKGKVIGVPRPTDDEERCMTYLALVNGAKGIIYWAYTSSRYNIVDYPEHWAYMKKLAGEVSSITPVLMAQTVDGKVLSTTGSNTLETMVKKMHGVWYVFAVNSARTPCKGSFRLSGVSPKSAEVLFEKRTVASNDGSWTDEFKPLEVHVYKLSSR